MSINKFTMDWRTNGESAKFYETCLSFGLEFLRDRLAKIPYEIPLYQFLYITSYFALYTSIIQVTLQIHRRFLWRCEFAEFTRASCMRWIVRKRFLRKWCTYFANEIETYITIMKQAGGLTLSLPLLLSLSHDENYSIHAHSSEL